MLLGINILNGKNNLSDWVHFDGLYHNGEPVIVLFSLRSVPPQFSANPIPATN